MNIVKTPVLPPGYCIATLTSDDPKGFIDTGLNPLLDFGGQAVVPDPRVYVSVTWIEQMAGALGMVDGEKFNIAERKIKTLEAQLKDADKLIEASEFMRTQTQVKRKRVPA